ncbi:MAG: hypothetical protein RDV48_20800 [Candidatus Eremiobacteraeota bacterium]|nr:hypothetical protein [Candidatus Eremiobacteraeota bacterium]
MITKNYLEVTFWTGVAIVIMVALSPLVYYAAARNEKHGSRRLIYLAIVLVFDIGACLWFLEHLHSSNITLPTLIKFYLQWH